jgi:hypothetical protein
VKKKHKPEESKKKREKKRKASATYIMCNLSTHKCSWIKVHIQHPELRLKLPDSKEAPHKQKQSDLFPV